MIIPEIRLVFSICRSLSSNASRRVSSRSCRSSLGNRWRKTSLLVIFCQQQTAGHSLAIVLPLEKYQQNGFAACVRFEDVACPSVRGCRPPGGYAARPWNSRESTKKGAAQAKNGPMHGRAKPHPRSQHRRQSRITVPHPFEKRKESACYSAL